MRLSAHCRADIIVTVANLLKCKSLVEVAQKSPVATSSTTTVSEDFDTLFALSPMQQWFFNQLGHHSVDEPGYHCNQSFYLHINKTVCVGSVHAAIAKTVEIHSMLRARFYQGTDSKWMQIIPQPSASNHRFETSMLESYADLAPFAALRQQQLLVERCLIEETSESALALGFTSSNPNIMNDLSLWDFQAGKTPNRVQDYINRTIIIDRDETRQLLGEANDAFNTQPVDLSLAAVSHAFFQIFPRDSFTIVNDVNESHGCDTLKEDTDLSETVGWFTTMYPLSIARSTNSSVSDIVRQVKDARKGLLAKMVFNYHGHFQQLERKAALFESITLEVSDEGPDLPVFALFEVNISIEQGKTNILFSWNRYLAHQQLIQEWPNQIVRSVRVICEDLSILDIGHPTLVDYKFLDPDYPGLDYLQSQIIPEVVTLNSSEIEDIYHCPPMVDGILLSQLKGSGSYATIQRYHIKPRNPNMVDIERL
ncbi:MAG: hypothetical protein Q9182_005179, partial [Xanthomendoza sp. 2 TL-2023]